MNNKTVTSAQLRRELRDYLHICKHTDTHVIVTSHRRATAVLMGVAEYEQLMKKLIKSRSQKEKKK